MDCSSPSVHLMLVHVDHKSLRLDDTNCPMSGHQSRWFRSSMVLYRFTLANSLCNVWRPQACSVGCQCLSRLANQDRVYCPCFLLCGLFFHLCVLSFLTCMNLSWVLAPWLGYQKPKKKTCAIYGMFNFLLLSSQDQWEITAMVKKLVLVKREARLLRKKVALRDQTFAIRWETGYPNK